MNTKTDTEGTKLKVLVLEDSTGDLELMREQLSNAGYRLDLTHVENEAGFTALMRENSFDLILADFKLPGFDAFGALEISQKFCPETPFICFSATIGEETAVELLKLGAVDYVLKDRPERLPFSVKRALEEAELKKEYQKAAEALRESEERFRVAQEMSPDGFTILHPVRNEKGEIFDFTWIYENQTIARINGTDPQLVKGKRLLVLFPTHLGTSVFETYLHVANTGEPRIIEEVYVGEVISRPTWLRLVVVSMGEDIAILSQDITGRKQAGRALEESELTFRKLFEESSDAILLIDETGVFVECNQAALDLLKMTREQFLFLAPVDISPEFQPNGRSSKEFAIEVIDLACKKELHCLDWTHVNAEGGEFIVDISLMPIIVKGKKMLHTTWRNITERRQTEAALRESEEMMRSSQSVAHICSYSTILNENETEKSQWVCSPEFYKMFGIDETYPHTIEGWAGIIHPEFREDILAYHESAVKEKIPFNKEYKIIRINDGAERWVHGSGELEFDEKGNPVRMHGAIQDITDRKRAEIIRQVQYSIAQASLTAKNSGELYDFIKNELNNIIDVSNFFIAALDEETGMLSKILDKDEKDEIMEWPAEKSLTGYLIRQNRPVLVQKNEIVRLQEEGTIELFGTIPEAWLGVPLSVEGKMSGAVVVQNYDNPDVYDQYSIEIMELVTHLLSMYIGRQLAEEKATKLARAVEQSSVSVLITNKEGEIEYVNSFFTELTGYSFEEAKGKTSSILKSGHQSTAFYRQLWGIILSGNDWEGEILNKKKTGELYWEKAVISPIVNSDGVITNFVAIKEDITERKKMVEELIEAKEKAEESDKLKTAFINNISHEIRTPLNGILGFGELISGMYFPGDEAAEMVKHVRQSSKRLTDTITDYVDMARIVSGTMEVNKKEFPLQPLIEEAINEIRPLSEEKKIGLKTVIPKQCDGIRLFSDKELIRKTINILLDNSLKFTSQGEIICGYRFIPGYLEFYVQDTGVGIAYDKLEMIFDMFAQEDTSDTRAYEGSGLGLAISHGLVNLLGGHISVTSERNKGSAFMFTVPYIEREAAEKAPLTEEENDTVAGKSLVLLAEDEESNYLYMEAVLRQAGYEYLLAKNGEEAVALCKQHPDITLVLMDIKMPVMNGVEATRRIREFRPEVTIIATTAYAQTGDEQRFLAAGFDGYLPKPIRTEKLFALLREPINRDY